MSAALLSGGLSAARPPRESELWSVSWVVFLGQGSRREARENEQVPGEAAGRRQAHPRVQAGGHPRLCRVQRHQPHGAPDAHGDGEGGRDGEESKGERQRGGRGRHPWPPSWICVRAKFEKKYLFRCRVGFLLTVGVSPSARWFSWI